MARERIGDGRADADAAGGGGANAAVVYSSRYTDWLSAMPSQSNPAASASFASATAARTERGSAMMPKRTSSLLRFQTGLDGGSGGANRSIGCTGVAPGGGNPHLRQPGERAVYAAAQAAAAQCAYRREAAVPVVAVVATRARPVAVLPVQLVHARRAVR